MLEPWHRRARYASPPKRAQINPGLVRVVIPALALVPTRIIKPVTAPVTATVTAPAIAYLGHCRCWDIVGALTSILSIE
jgi:hypothetical protein